MLSQWPTPSWNAFDGTGYSQHSQQVIQYLYFPVLIEKFVISILAKNRFFSIPTGLYQNVIFKTQHFLTVRTI